MGNRLRQNDLGPGQGITSYVYNSSNELMSSAGPGGSTTFNYDNNGNLIARTAGSNTWAYLWDPSNRLGKVSKNNVVEGIYAYDAKGRMVESVESQNKFYAYLGTETLYEGVPATLTNTDYVYASGMRIAKVSGTTVSYYHTDILGSTRLVTGTSGNVVFSDNYMPFGQDYVSSGTETYKFTGKPYSSATGLYYYYQRWYDPSIGRFISPDPRPGKLSNPQSLNLYIYVLNVPTSLTDPSGLDWWNPFTWSQQQQAQAFTIAVIAVSVVVVVATFGVGTPLAAAAIGAAIGASTSTAAYTITQGDKASLKGAAFSALTGAVAGAIGGGAGGLALNFVKAGGSIAAGMLAAGAGQALGRQVGNLVGDMASGKTYSANVGQIFTDFGIGAVTFGVGGKLGMGSDPATMAENRMHNSLGTGQATLDRYFTGSIVQSEITRWTTAIIVGQTGYSLGTQAVEVLIDYFTQ
ncbi:MAG TPA: RHS repeat-associated core domain-containing protein [Candidatus Bathyarchaeia archaeon]|nr:RHS repeat-associated core domain-containing protein [Candidatus Bathyarchaeia archaeon]